MHGPLPTFQQRKEAGGFPGALFIIIHGFSGNLADKYSKTGSGLGGALTAAEKFHEGSIL